jgi:diguanylate cyclase (GGDEF)-like protein
MHGIRTRIRARTRSFGLRLGLALAGSMLVAVLGIMVVSADLIADGLLEEGKRAQKANAAAIEAAFAEAGPGEDPFDEVAEVVEGLANRPDTLGVYLVDGSETVIASHDESEVGERDDNPHFRAALRDGTSYAGGESDSDEGASEFEFVTPLRLGGEPYALEVDQDGRALDTQIAAVRRTTAFVGGGALLLGLLLFYILGGRSLVRHHGRVVRRATLDPLTDLGNHRSFQEELARAVSHAARRGEPLALALLDLDDFKLINDRDGHPKGDELLVQMARVLESGRREDRAFRIGGDEFALLLIGTDGDGARTALEHRRAVAREAGMATAFTAGIAVMAPGADGDPQVLWEQTDAALYEGKRAGGDTVVVFDDVADLLSVVTPAKVRALRSLLEEPRMDIAFQPIWQLRDERMLGMEALARPREGYGFDGPAEAFAVAEKVGRGPELDALCRAAALARADELPPDALLFLNLSPQTLERDGLSGDRLLRAVRDAGLEPDRVVLEITERAQARVDQVAAEAARLQGLGFRIALDDVGVGTSGLEMLRRLDLDFEGGPVDHRRRPRRPERPGRAGRDRRLRTPRGSVRDRGGHRVAGGAPLRAARQRARRHAEPLDRGRAGVPARPALHRRASRPAADAGAGDVRRVAVPPGGLEPPTLRLKGARSAS